MPARVRVRVLLPHRWRFNDCSGFAPLNCPCRCSCCCRCHIYTATAPGITMNTRQRATCGHGSRLCTLTCPAQAAAAHVAHASACSPVCAPGLKAASLLLFSLASSPSGPCGPCSASGPSCLSAPTPSAPGVGRFMKSYKISLTPCRQFQWTMWTLQCVWLILFIVAYAKSLLPRLLTGLACVAAVLAAWQCHTANVSPADHRVSRSGQEWCFCLELHEAGPVWQPCWPPGSVTTHM